MSRLKIEFKWKLRGQLHVGSGIGRVGYADSILRKAGDGANPIIPGDAVKGAIREAAERLLHWLLPGKSTALPDNSFPDHPAMKCLFAPPPDKTPFYRFSGGKLAQAGFLSMRSASTAINNATGIADDASLRIMETLAPEHIFNVAILGEGGDWCNQDAPDRQDLIFLLAALFTLESIGGKKGNGHGEVAIEELVCAVDGQDILPAIMPDGKWTEDMIKRLKTHVQGQIGG